MTERFDAEWLVLREPFDHAARSMTLARRLVDHLPTNRPKLVDLGAGIGSLFRYLAPLVGRGQDWLLIDADTELLDDAFGRTAAWARRRGYGVTIQGDALLVYTPRGMWRMEAVELDLATMPYEVELPKADAVVCSALLDLVSGAWLRRLISSLRTPFLASLTVDGRDLWLPSHGGDPVVIGAFRRSQRRAKGLGPALGTAASATALHCFAECGFATSSAAADWRVSRSALRMQRALVESTAQGARSGNHLHDRAISVWQAARLHQALLARLAIRIGHRDILALPPGG